MKEKIQMYQQYWNFMTQYKYTLLLLDEHFSSSVDIDRRVNMFLAITSSTSIAAWAVWSQMNFLWAIIIAASHVVTSIKNFLPYGKRIGAITELKTKLSSIYINMEYKWYNVCQVDTDEGEINDMLHNFKVQWNEAGVKTFVSDYLPKNAKFEENAEREKEEYFNKFFAGGF